MNALALVGQQPLPIKPLLLLLLQKSNRLEVGFELPGGNCRDAPSGHCSKRVAPAVRTRTNILMDEFDESDIYGAQAEEASVSGDSSEDESSSRGHSSADHEASAGPERHRLAQSTQNVLTIAEEEQSLSQQIIRLQL